MIIYTVRPGDSVYSIAQRYGVTASQVIEDNALSQQGSLVPGQALVIMTDTIPHTVRRGESFYSIARRYGVTYSQLVEANPQISDPSRIFPGEVIAIPASQQKLGSIVVNGFCFPGIDRGVLSRTLPYLTYLSIFSYMVRPNGSLSTLEDEPLIQAAYAQNVAPIMVVANIEEGAGFSSELAHTLLTEEQAQAALLNNIQSTLDSKDYYGLCIDFEYIFPEDREAYNRFVERTVERLRPLGYTIMTALAPKTSAGQAGLLYQAHDYPAHGRLLDYVILMTYEWGYTYGPPMAVAPADQVRRVLNYAVTAINPEKILMGMPNYGYDWTLPYRQGTAARSLSNISAVNLAVREGATIRFDTKSQAPYFNYTDDAGARHVVWFEDARSIQARLRLVNEYGLGGVSYWTVNQFFPQNWLVLTSMYDVTKVF